MAAGNITKLTADKFIPELWSKEIMRAREKKLTLAAHVKRFDSEFANKGDVLHVPRRSVVTALTLAPGASVTYDAVTEGELLLSIDTQAYYAFLLPDVVKTQSSYDLMKEYTEGAGYALEKKVDDALFALGAGVSQSITTANTTLRIATTMITGANMNLDVADAPEEDRFMTVDGYGYKQLLDLDSFVRYDAIGGNGQSPIKNGKVGEAYGLGILKTNNQTAPSAKIDVHRALWIHGHKRRLFYESVSSVPRTKYPADEH
jgi:hypothetical protein